MCMPIIQCKICRELFYVKPSHVKKGWGKYCSISCRSKSQLNGKNLKCFVCNKTIYRTKTSIKKSKSNKFFCSKKCQTKWRNSIFIEDKHSNWTSGVSSYKHILKRHIKPKCVLCGTNDNRVLICHHVDHNRYNNKINNLTWLCCNCHQIVHKDALVDDRIKKMVGVAQLV